MNPVPSSTTEQKLPVQPTEKKAETTVSPLVTGEEDLTLDLASAKPLSAYSITPVIFSKIDIPWNEVHLYSSSEEALEEMLGIKRGTEKMVTGGQTRAVECWIDRGNQKQVVIKFVDEKKAKQDTSLKKYMHYDKGEAIALQADDHPHIVKTHCLLLKDAATQYQNKCAYALVNSAQEWENHLQHMELNATISNKVQGMDMFNFFVSPPTSNPNYLGNPVFIIPTVLAITRALIHLHEKDIIYRDLKLENIMINPTDNHITLIDFGYARKLSRSERTTSFCGTYETMAPEVISKLNYGHNAEKWSLGQIMLFLLTCTYITDMAVKQCQTKARESTVRRQAALDFAHTDESQKRSYLTDNTFASPGANSQIVQALQELTLGLLKKDPAARLSLYELKDQLKALGQQLSIPDPYIDLDRPPQKPKRQASKK